jgi:hypothetical protein
MISIILFTLNLLVPSPWNVRPVYLDTMKSTLSLWRKDYESSSTEYKSSFEIVGWHASTNYTKMCFGIYHKDKLRALSQVYRTGDDTRLRSVITPKDEDVAGTILMYKIFQCHTKVDWCAIQNNPRWYIAAIFMKLS